MIICQCSIRVLGVFGILTIHLCCNVRHILPGLDVNMVGIWLGISVVVDIELKFRIACIVRYMYLQNKDS